MTRPEITAKLSAMIEKKINPHNDPRIYWAKEVTFDYSTDHAVRVDYMRFVPANNSVSGIEKGDCYCYEIKSSAEDFRSGHGLNFVGDYNYLVMPTDVCAAVSLEIPHYVGIYVPGEPVDCYTEEKKTYTCDKCGKKFTMYGYQAGWKYQTETIDGEVTEEEVEEL